MKSLVFCAAILTYSGVLTQTEFGYHRDTKSVTSDEQFRSGPAKIWNISVPTDVLLPKCCPYGKAVGLGNCTDISVNFQPSFHVHEHNETAFDDVPIKSEYITFKTYIQDPCERKKFPLSPDEDPKILLNGSLLVAGLGEYDGILSHNQFCIDNLKDTTNTTDSTVYAFLCIREHIGGYPQWVFSIYISLTTVSAMLFGAAALFFYRQDLQCSQKKSFVAYSFSMSGTYILIILIQFVSGGCKVYGLILQFFILLSFAWFAILWFDLAWMIHFYQIKDNKDRSYFYIASAVIYSTIFLIVSFSNDFTPDIPSSFFKPQFKKTVCSGFDAEQHNVSFYTALLLAVLSSLISLVYCLIKMNQNRYHNTSQGVILWQKTSKRFRYMFIQCFLIVKTALISLIADIAPIFFELDWSGQTPLLFLQGMQGMFVVAIAGSFWSYMKNLDEQIEEESNARTDLLENKNFEV
ncbi:hypothetical protein WA026_016884 [Henosepilachna vigintioctopunctata]|uniref:Uncharacterized protein n=1 Tax=Henosepilachna vigintioctopunctata TaxID=420089 RepID=A0AAW1UD05_9CUCU